MTLHKHKLVDILANFAAISALLLHIFNPGQVIAETSIDPNDAPEATITPDAVAEPQPDRVVKVTFTAYTSSVDETDSTPCISADGTNICKHADEVIAVNGLPFGTRITIPELFGDQVFVVHDRMNKRYSCKLNGYCRMDVYFKTGGKAAARKFGVRSAETNVYLVKKEIAKAGK